MIFLFRLQNGAPLNKDLAVRWQKYLTNRVENEIKEQEKRALPDNCSPLQPSSLTKEVEFLLTDPERKTDSFLTHIQLMIEKGLGTSLNKLLDKEIVSEDR